MEGWMSMALVMKLLAALECEYLALEKKFLLADNLCLAIENFLCLAKERRCPTLEMKLLAAKN